MLSMSILKTDYLVIGSGLAGLSAALRASQFGSVILLTKSSLDVSNTYWAQGGIAAAIGSDDSAESHFLDTLSTGAGLCHKEAVRILVYEGVERIKELIDMGMEFDMDDGNIAFGLEGGHSNRRVLHAGGDATGKELVKFFLKLVRNSSSIKIFEHCQTFELIIDDSTCCGVHAFNLSIGETHTFLSKAVFIATGGTSGIYLRTTNPHSTTGDGIVLAYNAGAEIANMEFIQFHPSSLVTETGHTFLISEAVRGEGAFLVNSRNERFMVGSHELAELAPRDVVAYEMYKQLQIPGNSIYLKLDHLDSRKIKSRFQNIYEELQTHGIDLAKDPVPVAPAAHYMIGGIKTGLYGEGCIHGLYAIGEVAFTGIHGANRLASNSLLECLVFSEKAVSDAVNKNYSMKEPYIKQSKYFRDIQRQEKYLQLRNRVATVLSNYVGIVRDETGLLKALEQFGEIESEYQFNECEYHSMRLKSLLTVARLITNSALIRKESRGGHIRSDFPDTSNEYLADILQVKDKQPILSKLENNN